MPYMLLYMINDKKEVKCFFSRTSATCQTRKTLGESSYWVLMKAAAPTFSAVNSSPYCTFASCMKAFTFSFVMLLQRVQFSRLSLLAVFSKSWSFMATETVPCWTCSTAGSEEQAAALMCSVRGGGGKSQAGHCWQFNAFYRKPGTNNSLMQCFSANMLLTWNQANQLTNHNTAIV